MSHGFKKRPCYKVSKTILKLCWSFCSFRVLFNLKSCWSKVCSRDKKLLFRLALPCFGSFFLQNVLWFRLTIQIFYLRSVTMIKIWHHLTLFWIIILITNLVVRKLSIENIRTKGKIINWKLVINESKMINLKP